MKNSSQSKWEGASAGNPYRGAYPFLTLRRGVWREIVRALARDAPGVETVIELGAGYCDFINQFPAPHKIAFDLNPEMRPFCAPDVELRIEDAVALEGIQEASVDLVFASNFLEHLVESDIHRILDNIHRVLRPGGRLMLIQPNYRLCEAHYFDDPTHLSVFSDENIGSYLARSGLKLLKLVPGYLPFSMQSRLPKWPILTRLYLLSPIKPLAAQMYALAERS
jgi:SAM-dependent methyltransferase